MPGWGCTPNRYVPGLGVHPWGKSSLHSMGKLHGFGGRQIVFEVRSNVRYRAGGVKLKFWGGQGQLEPLEP